MTFHSSGFFRYNSSHYVLSTKNHSTLSKRMKFPKSNQPSEIQMLKPFSGLCFSVSGIGASNWKRCFGCVCVCWFSGEVRFWRGGCFLPGPAYQALVGGGVAAKKVQRHPKLHCWTLFVSAPPHQDTGGRSEGKMIREKREGERRERRKKWKERKREG